jgi:hypothetical protein
MEVIDDACMVYASQAFICAAVNIFIYAFLPTFMASYVKHNGVRMLIRYYGKLYFDCLQQCFWSL